MRLPTPLIQEGDGRTAHQHLGTIVARSRTELGTKLRRRADQCYETATRWLGIVSSQKKHIGRVARHVEGDAKPMTFRFSQLGGLPG